jgi:hypothetical protein
MLPPNRPSFSSSLKYPPLLLRNRFRPQTNALPTIPAMNPIDRIGCPEIAPRISKKNFSKFEMVDLGLIFGGEMTTLGNVSRIDVRDAMIELPVMVVSQYLRFCSND